MAASLCLKKVEVRSKEAAYPCSPESQNERSSPRNCDRYASRDGSLYMLQVMYISIEVYDHKQLLLLPPLVLVLVLVLLPLPCSLTLIWMSFCGLLAPSCTALS